MAADPFKVIKFFVAVFDIFKSAWSVLAAK